MSDTFEADVARLLSGYRAKFGGKPAAILINQATWEAWLGSDVVSSDAPLFDKPPAIATLYGIPLVIDDKLDIGIIAAIDVPQGRVMTVQLGGDVKRKDGAT